VTVPMLHFLGVLYFLPNLIWSMLALSSFVYSLNDIHTQHKLSK